MRIILRIMKTELRVFFFSPIAWLTLIVFAFQVGISFCGDFGDQLRYQSLGYSPFNTTMRLVGGYGGLMSKMLDNLYLYIPLLTMGLMSRELYSGSIKLLYSSPVSNLQIILGKYFSVMIYGLALIALLFAPTILVMFGVKNADVPVIFTTLLGVYLTICAYGAVGLFMSTITRYQVVAVVGSLAVLAILNFIGGIGQEIDFVRDITYWLSISGRSEVFMEGMICSKDLVYFLLVIFLFLSLSIIKLHGERLKLPMWNKSLRYGGVVVLVLLIGYLTSRPGFIKYYDATATKRNTLTENSQAVLEKIKGGLTITTYVNFFDDTYHRGSPSMRIRDIENFDRYVRFKPEIKLKYVYYYGPGKNEYLFNQSKGMTMEQILVKRCESYNCDPKKFIPLSEVVKTDDITNENGRFMRVLSTDDGRKARLRIYEDQQIDPSETEMTAAFKTLIQKSPLIAFVTGHSERSVDDYSDRGYVAFAQDGTFRYSLINQGFRVQNITLSQPVPPEVDVLVFVELKSPLTGEEQTNYQSYLDRGGNAVIIGEPRRQSFMNPLIAPLGLQFSQGVVVAPSKQYLDDEVACEISENAAMVSGQLGILSQRGYKIMTPGVCAVEVTDSTKGFEIAKILTTKSQGSWIETQTTDFINQKSTLDASHGEVAQSYATLLYLTRSVSDRQQRIFVIGDADCMSNYVLRAKYPGINTSNFSLITEMFRNLSYDEYPVVTSRPRPYDDLLYPSQKSMWWINLIYIWIIPGLLIAGCIYILYSRKRK